MVSEKGDVTNTAQSTEVTSGLLLIQQQKAGQVLRQRTIIK